MVVAAAFVTASPVLQLEVLRNERRRTKRVRAPQNRESKIKKALWGRRAPEIERVGCVDQSNGR